MESPLYNHRSSTTGNSCTRVNNDNHDEEYDKNSSNNNINNNSNSEFGQESKLDSLDGFYDEIQQQKDHHQQLQEQEQDHQQRRRRRDRRHSTPTSSTTSTATSTTTAALSFSSHNTPSETFKILNMPGPRREESWEVGHFTDLERQQPRRVQIKQQQHQHLQPSLSPLTQKHKLNQRRRASLRDSIGTTTDAGDDDDDDDDYAYCEDDDVMSFCLSLHDNDCDSNNNDGDGQQENGTMTEQTQSSNDLKKQTTKDTTGLLIKTPTQTRQQQKQLSSIDKEKEKDCPSITANSESKASTGTTGRRVRLLRRRDYDCDEEDDDDDDNLCLSRHGATVLFRRAQSIRKKFTRARSGGGGGGGGGAISWELGSHYSASHHGGDKSGGDGDSSVVTSTRNKGGVFFAFLVLIAAVVAFTVYRFSTEEDVRGYESRFQEWADQITEGIKTNSKETLAFYESWSLHISSGSTASSASASASSAWPNVTLSNFEVQGQDAILKTGARLVAFAIVVDVTERQAWEAYAIEHQGWLHESFAYAKTIGYDAVVTSDDDDTGSDSNGTNTEDVVDITENIFRPLSPPLPAQEPIVDDKYLPIWQAAPVVDNYMKTNYDTFNLSYVPNVYRRMVQVESAVLSEAIVTQPEDNMTTATTTAFNTSVVDSSSSSTSTRPPESFMMVPVYDQVSVTDRQGDNGHGQNKKIVAVLVAMLRWEDFFKNLIPEGIPPTTIVVSNPCLSDFTYQVYGPHDVTFIGYHDQHDEELDDIQDSFTFDTFANVEECTNTIHIYPTREFHSTYVTNRPLIYTSVSVAMFLLTFIAFFVYDMILERKQRKIINAAQRSNALVSSLFPENVRSRILGQHLFQGADGTTDLSGQVIVPTTSMTTPVPATSSSLTSASAIGKHHPHAHGQRYDRMVLPPTSPYSKPIADLFPHATVLFADIAGFTAWASSREPSQVFMLLEGIYNSFDRIAQKEKVFKVETIGDCYVAATGLPEPREDHAVVMAQFARDCLTKMVQVVRELEVTLGPDTAELGMRAGLHSGPVTAGVLRGDKSRFQLFGDTVNTASRMESTGAINSIHLSQQTADLILSGCKNLSVRPRDQMVEVKGKGKMQTYWLLFDDGEHTAQIPDMPRDRSGLFQDSSSVGSSQGFSSNSRQGLRKSFSIMGGLSLPSEKHERLIDWNVDVLQGLLKKVVAMRRVDRVKPIKKIAKYNIKTEEGQLVIDEVREVLSIPSKKARFYLRDPNQIELGSVVVAQLRDYVTVIASKYKRNFFHSFEHASHVTQSVIKLLTRVVSPESIDYDELTYKKKKTAALHEFTYGITSDPITQFAVALSALIHDVDHQGVPNAQLVKENTEEAARYRNKSVAEQNSVDLAWDLLMKPDYVDLRACIYNSRKELKRFRQLVVNAVMATDIVDKELGALRKKRWEKAFNHISNTSSHGNSVTSGNNSNNSNNNNSNTENDMLDDDLHDEDAINRKATIVIEHLIQASDVSHTMQHWHVYVKWNERFFHECYQAYLDGRSENDPADGWYNGEIGFFDYYVIPLAKKLKECGCFGISSAEFLNYAESNRDEWKRKGEDLVEKYLATYKEKVFGGFRSASNIKNNNHFPGPPPM